MLTSINHQSWLFFLPLAQQASLLKDDLLDPVDDRLDDEELMALVRHCLATRYPQSARTGRPGMAPDRLLRSCVLKHLKGWSFRRNARSGKNSVGFDEPCAGVPAVNPPSAHSSTRSRCGGPCIKETKTLKGSHIAGFTLPLRITQSETETAAA